MCLYMHIYIYIYIYIYTHTHTHTELCRLLPVSLHCYCSSCSFYLGMHTGQEHQKDHNKKEYFGTEIVPCRKRTENR